MILEVAFICDDFHCTPAVLGFDERDPRLLRDIRLARNIYETAKSYQDASDKAKWKKSNKSGNRLLQWARGGESKSPDPTEVRIEIPQREDHAGRNKD